jgi:hypothetical protein
VAPVTAKPNTVDEAPDDDNVLIVLALILTTGDVFAHVKPVTEPPVPVDDKPVMVLFAIFKGLAKLPDAPIVIPVIVL